MIAVVDYGMGNLRSVSKALEFVGAEVSVTSDAGAIAAADGVVLPGVGAFARCMDNLRTAGLEAAVKAAAASGRPFLGICVGMQILFEQSHEFGRVDGLGILPGTVRRFKIKEAGVKVPHMGWNQIRLNVHPRPPVLKGIADGASVYFVHSFYADCDLEGLASTVTDYGGEVASSVWQGNVFATQFHPEKSQSVGLKLLENFSALAAGHEL